METILRDLRYGIHMLAARPGFTAVVVLTLSLGIGAVTAMFSIVNGVLLRPLPYEEPEQLVRIHTQRSGRSFGSISQPEYLDLLESTQSFRDIGLYRYTDVNLFDGDGEPEHLLGVRIVPGVLDAMGIAPALGRALEPEEGWAGNHRVAVISDRLWKRRFGSDSAIVGRSLRILNDRFEIIGVMPEGFEFPSNNIDLWVGFGLDRANPRDRGSHSANIISRLQQGVSVEQAQSELEILSRRLRQDYPEFYAENSGFHFVVQPYLENVAGAVRPALLVLMGAVGFVLLIACVNVSNLLLARITGREKEMAIRASLGAGQGRIVSQLLTESLLFAVLGGLGALVVAEGAYRALVLLHPESLPRLGEVAVDTNVLLFNLGLVLFATVAVGVIQALRISRMTMAEKLKDGSREGASAGRHRTRAALVVTEVVLATVLLVGAGLLIRSVGELLAVESGFRPEHILTTRLTLSGDRYPDSAARGDFFRRLIEELEAQSDVVNAAVINTLPMSGNRVDWYIVAEGYTPTDPNSDFIQYRMVTPDYFRTLGIPLLRGRSFTDQDTIDSRPVAIISESLARKYWGEEDPIGRRIRPGGADDASTPWHTVVGVVGEVHHLGARQGDIPIWYRSVYQDCWSSMSLAVRTTGDPAVAVRGVKAAVARIDPQQPIYQTRVMTEMVGRSLSRERFSTNVLMAFAGLALGLAAIGIFGVTSYSVSQRTREIGIRMALGARTGEVLGNVLGEGLKLIMVGLAIGVVASLSLAQFLKWLLFGVEAYDPVTFAGAALVLLGAGIVACLLPARRATQVDPNVALRCE